MVQNKWASEQIETDWDAEMAGGKLQALSVPLGHALWLADAPNISQSDSRVQW